MKYRRGISEVIATVILTAVALVVGTTVWAYAKGTTSIMSNDYSSNMLTNVNNLQEKFSLSNIYYYKTNSTLYLYVYNYGSEAIQVDTYVTLITGSIRQQIGIEISSKQFYKIVINNLYIQPNSMVKIDLVSRRGNFIHDQYFVS